MKHAVFLIDLNQDVAASRSIAVFFRRESPLAILFMTTAAFRKRDATGVWQAEVKEIVAELNAELVEIASVADAIQCLIGKAGLLLSTSESALAAHTFSHATFLAAPVGFTRVTIQHGLECIGFNHNAAHDAAWRHYVGMAGDIAASWFEIGTLHSVRPDQRAKVMTLGPPIGLERTPTMQPSSQRKARKPVIHGLICENLHSVRFGADSKLRFVNVLSSFAQKLESVAGTIELRPHPGGLYLERNKDLLPANIRLNRLPLYKQELDKFSFCISGASSILLDLVWAEVPVAVWSSGDSRQDIGIYSGLHVVSDASEWFEFAVAATADPAPFLEAQARYIASLGIPADIPARYRELAHLADE